MLRMMGSAAGCALMMLLAGCSSEAPPVVQVSGSGGGMSAQTIADQLNNMQGQINELQQQVDALRQQKAGQ